MRNNVRVSFNGKTARKFRHRKPKYLWFVKCAAICNEVAEYIASHEAAGIHFDTEYQEIAYDDCVTFMLRKEGGCWYIVEILVSKPVTEYRPVFIWKRIKRGAWEVMARFMAGWRTIRSECVEAAC